MMISNLLNEITRTHYDEELKVKLLDYMNQRSYVEWASTYKIIDRVTGEKVFSVCHVGYYDGEFQWTSSETYHLEQYDLKLSDDFVDHVKERYGL